MSNYQQANIGSHNGILPEPMTASLMVHIDGLVQYCSISIATALENLLSCTKPLIYIYMYISQPQWADPCGLVHVSPYGVLKWNFNFSIMNSNGGLIHIQHQTITYTIIGLTHWGLVTPYGDIDLIWGQFHNRYTSHQLPKLFWKLLIQNFLQISQGPMS